MHARSLLHRLSESVLERNDSMYQTVPEINPVILLLTANFVGSVTVMVPR